MMGEGKRDRRRGEGEYRGWWESDLVTLGPIDVPNPQGCKELEPPTPRDHNVYFLVPVETVSEPQVGSDHNQAYLKRGSGNSVGRQQTDTSPGTRVGQIRGYTCQAFGDV